MKYRKAETEKFYIRPRLEPPSDKTILIAYLQMKVSQGDWHGVSDAANDLRELEAREERKP